MLGDLRKPSAEFTSDLCQIAHKTRLVKRQMAESCTKSSPGLKEMRMTMIEKRKYKALAEHNEDRLSAGSSERGYNSDDSELQKFIRRH